MGGEGHHKAHPVFVLRGSQQRSAEKVSPGFMRAHSHTAFSSYSGGEERKGTFAVQTGLWFTGKGRRFFRGPLQEASVTQYLTVEKPGRLQGSTDINVIAVMLDSCCTHLLNLC